MYLYYSGCITDCNTNACGEQNAVCADDEKKFKNFAKMMPFYMIIIRVRLKPLKSHNFRVKNHIFRPKNVIFKRFDPLSKFPFLACTTQIIIDNSSCSEQDKKMGNQSL